MFVISGVLLAVGFAAAQNNPPADPQSTSKFDTATLTYKGCAPGQSKLVKATVTVTDENGKSASRSTEIRINCEPPYQRFPDLIFRRNDAHVNACSKGILMDEVAAAMASGEYTAILIGHRSDEETSEPGATVPLDLSRAVNAAAALVRCGKVKASAVRIDVAGSAKNPVPTSVACPEFSGPTGADWQGRVEVYLVPAGSKYLPENAKHLAPPPANLPEVTGCAAVSPQ